jgi:penicillin-binding protein 1C
MGASLAVAITVSIVMAWPINSDVYLAVHPSGEFLDRSGTLLYPYLNPEEQWLFERDLKQISPHLVQATIATEDKRFFHHPGVDPVAVVRAMSSNVIERRVVSGASTLTMQVVKQQCTLGRGVTAKAWQAIEALRLELRTNKRELLRAYLNTAPYGMNLVGCEAASRRYFGKPASELSVPEAALLAGLPQAPTNLNPLKYPERALVRRDHVLRRMRAENMLSDVELERHLGVPLKVAWHEFPRAAPHLAARYAARKQSIQSTLDYALQTRVERLARDTVAAYDGNITNAAVLVVDVPAAEVRAYVGGTGFWDAVDGQVDVARAPRSPGSVLKPFTYAVAMQENRVYPSEMLLDNTLDYGLYNPENYDSNYRGLVSATYALRRSLNVPAVMVLERAGTERLYTFLQRAGLSTLAHGPMHYGLGLTLGNCEARLDEVVAAYAALANGGMYRSLRLTQSGERAAGVRILDTGVSDVMVSMLTQPLPGEIQDAIVRARGTANRVAWKTGTSSGNHDAWTVMFDRQYVVGVWMGNNDGKPSGSLVGVRAAQPLAADVFKILPRRGTMVRAGESATMHQVQVCATSGMPVSKWCPHRREVLFPKRQYLHRRCGVHVPGQWSADGVSKVATVWPGSASDWDLANVKAGVAVQAGQERPRHASALKILTPPDNSEYVLTGEKNADRIALKSNLDATAPIHWYMNAKYLGVSGAHEALYVKPKPGQHTVVAMTAGGETDRITFEAF